jgi:putative transposase
MSSRRVYQSLPSLLTATKIRLETQLPRSSFYHAAKPKLRLNSRTALWEGRIFLPKTSDGRADAPSPSRIAGIIPKAPNEIWTGDITYIKTNMEWRYLAVVLDRYSRRVVGWSLADHMRSDLVCDALKMAIATRSNIKGVIFHSDRGSQYGSCPFRGLLKSPHRIQSMSARANPYDNAWTESFIGTLKKEMGVLLHKLDPQQIQLNCFHYIEGYYNTQRRHSAPGYISPSKFEAIHSLN